MQRYEFHKLTPFPNADISIYEDALDFAIESNDIRNIAVTGAYGSGKSSVALSYLNAHPNLKPVYISLAHFNGFAVDNSVAECLEAEIINQLVQKGDNKHIGDSRYQRMDKTSRLNVVKNVLFLALLVVLMLFIFWQDEIAAIYHKIIQHYALPAIETPRAVFISIAGILVILISARFIYLIYRAQIKHRAIKRVSLPNNLSIEVQGEAESIDTIAQSSFFNRHMSEVLFLFREYGTNCFVFEDIDRYDNIEIFTQLRKLNQILNDQITRDNDRKIRNRLCRFLKIAEPNWVTQILDRSSIKFIYLVKDSLMDGIERTKFFDIIIPIVPIIAKSTSYAILNRELDAMELRQKPDDQFLKSVSLHIGDKRLLNNILNEYYIYHQKILADGKASPDQLFALVMYKNILPFDYELLCRNEGVMHFLLTDRKETLKQELRQELVGSIAKKNNEVTQEQTQLENALAKIDSEHLILPADLEAILIDEANDDENIFQYARRVNNQNYLKLVKELQDENEQYKDELRSAISSHGIKHNKLRREIDEIEKQINSLSQLPIPRLIQLASDTEQQHSITENAVFDYIGISQFGANEENAQSDDGARKANEGERNDFSTDRSDNKNVGAQNEPVGSSRTEPQGRSIKNEINSYRPFNRRAKDIIRNIDFILLLVENGYINEDFESYITFFMESDLSRADTDFILRIHARDAYSPHLPVNKPKSVDERLNEYDLASEATLNYDYLKLFAKGANPYRSPRFELLIDTAMNNKHYGFFLSGKSHIEKWNDLVNAINNLRPFFLANAIEDDYSDEKELVDYLFTSLAQCNQETIEDMNAYEEISNWIVEADPLANVNLPDDADAIIDGLEMLNVKVEDLSNFHDYNFADRLYDRRLFRINSINVEHSYETYYIGENRFEWEKAATLIQSEAYQPLLEMFKDNPDDFLKCIIDNSESIVDDKQIALEILINENVSATTRVAYLTKLNHQIDSISEINNEQILAALVNEDKIEFSLTNLEILYNEEPVGFDEKTIKYVRNCAQQQLNPVEDKANEFVTGSILLEALKASDKLKENAFLLLCSYADKKCLSIEDYSDWDNLEDWVLKALVDQDLLNPDTLTSKHIESERPDLLIAYTGNNVDEFAAQIDNEEIVLDDATAEQLLNSELIPIALKELIAKRLQYFIPLEIVISEDSVASIIIARDMYSENELELADLHKKASPGIRHEIETILANKISSLLEDGIRIEKNLSRALISKDNGVSQQDKLKLLTNNIDDYEKYEAKQILYKIDYPLTASSLEGKRPKVRPSKSLLSFIEAAKNRGWISSYKNNSDGTTTLYGRK